MILGSIGTLHNVQRVPVEPRINLISTPDAQINLTKSCHSVSHQVNRFVRGIGPDFVWQVAPITDTWEFVAKLLELHDEHAARQWQAMSMDDRVAASASADEALMDSPPIGLALSYDFAGEAWSGLVDWMDQQQWLKGRAKSSRRTAAAAVCHRKVGDKRVAMWILRFGTHKRALEHLEQQRTRALEHSQGSASQGSAAAARARKKRYLLRLADVTRMKMRLSNSPSGYCSCGQYGPQFECVHCRTQYCQKKCQVTIEKANESA